ncbi:(2Fe-2S)-binding protein [Alteribacillus sp. YIM 98480]|uniref:(2Fe-2S)-binding protein n=1 Tax=Alteribacillus sp. YIM 98480 TaxID=2606599 RepID=UPI00131C1B2D|nr:(2Fe-2S)-binding protein [Alteribacillus sp. YIM 98480]
MQENTHTMNITVNGVNYEKEVPVRKLLSDFLREDLGLTGTHVGCEHGVCGACTLFVNGEAIRSCLMFAIQADGADVTTIEGLERNGELHPMQESFSECHGLQCGFCTPGMMMAAIDFLKHNPNPTEQEVKEGMSGNICRCTGYKGIVDSVLKAAPLISKLETKSKVF